MSSEDQERLDAAIRWFEHKKGRQLTPDKIARFTEQINRMSRRQRTFEWMYPFLIRQTSRTPNFTALYEQKVDLDRRLLGDSNP